MEYPWLLDAFSILSLAALRIMKLSMDRITSSKEILTMMCYNITHVFIRNSDIVDDFNQQQLVLDRCHNP